MPTPDLTKPRRSVSAALACAAALGIAGGGALALQGCKRKSDDGSAPSGIAPTAAAPGAAAPPAAAPPAAAPPVAEGATPPAGGAAQTITGKITLGAERRGDVTPNDTVYLVARTVPDTAGQRGSLVAVKRFSASSFPIEFTLGTADMMFAKGPLPAELELAARVDKDGDPITRKKGDVFGAVGRVKVGATGVEVKLVNLQKEDESLIGPAPGARPGAGIPGHP